MDAELKFKGEQAEIDTQYTRRLRIEACAVIAQESMILQQGSTSFSRKMRVVGHEEKRSDERLDEEVAEYDA